MIFTILSTKIVSHMMNTYIMRNILAKGESCQDELGFQRAAAQKLRTTIFALVSPKLRIRIFLPVKGGQP